MPKAEKSLHVKSGDAEIYCEIYGEKNVRPLILLHGNGEDLHYFDPQIDFFQKSFKVIAIDSRGHGKSTRGTAGLDFYTLAKDVLVVLDTFCIEKTHMLGFSDGANIALHLAIVAPERFYSMILLGANYNPKGILLKYILPIRLNYIWLDLLSVFSKKSYLKKEIWNLMVHHPNLTLEKISNIKIPTLIVTGEKDMVSQRQNDEINNAIDGSERIIVKKGNHFLSAKMPDEFNKIVDSFLHGISDVV